MTQVLTSDPSSVTSNHDPIQAFRDRRRTIETKAIDYLETQTRAACITQTLADDFCRCAAGTMVTSTGELSVAKNLQKLEKLGRFRIVSMFGWTVVGYWSENDPLKPGR